MLFSQSATYSQGVDSLSVMLPKVHSNNNGYDSLGYKQGFWNEKIFYGDYLLFFEDSVEAPDAYAYGFYVDDKKVGFWDIKTSNKDGSGSLIAQLFYENDTMKFQFTYIDSKIHQYTRIGYKDRQYNSGSNGVIYAIDRIVFDSNGKIKYRESYAPDGVYEKVKY